MEVGLDCFSPTLTHSVGQDLKALNQIGDWIKPMTYLHTFAPAGLPFEVNGMLEILGKKHAHDNSEKYKWFSEATKLSLPEKKEILLQKGLLSASLKSEVAKARDLVSSPIYAGIEMVSIDGVTYIDPIQFKEDMCLLKETSANGIVLSWDLWHIKTEHLLTIKDVINTQVF